jgi:hypothetical protein
MEIWFRTLGKFWTLPGMFHVEQFWCCFFKTRFYYDFFHDCST